MKTILITLGIAFVLFFILLSAMIVAITKYKRENNLEDFPELNKAINEKDVMNLRETLNDIQG